MCIRDRSWDALAHPGPGELVRQGSAGASSVVAGGRNQGRNQGSDENISGRRRKGKPGCGIGGGGGGGIGGGDDGNSAKIDTEWENEIAKNILSLYQTKLKDELDKRREAREEEAGVGGVLVWRDDALVPYLTKDLNASVAPGGGRGITHISTMDTSA